MKPTHELVYKALLLVVVIQTFEFFFKFGFFNVLKLGFEALIIVYLTFFVVFNVSELNESIIGFLIFFVLFSVFHWVINPSSDFVDFLKIFGVVILFTTGYILNKTQKSIPLPSRNMVYAFLFIPVMVLMYQLLFGKSTLLHFSIFKNSNNYIYYCIVCSLFLLIDKKNNLFFALYISLNCLLSTTIGAILSITIAVLIYYRSFLFKRISYALGMLFGLSAIVVFVIYVDIPITNKIKGSIELFSSLNQQNSLDNFADISYGEAMRFTENSQNTSFLFRIKHWSDVVKTYLNLSFENKLFGAGFGSVRRSVNGMMAHNDYLGFIFQMGFLLFFIVLLSFVKILKLIVRRVEFIPFCAIFIYYFTENLFTNFLVGALQYFLLGCVYASQVRVNNEEKILKILMRE